MIFLEAQLRMLKNDQVRMLKNEDPPSKVTLEFHIIDEENTIKTRLGRDAEIPVEKDYLPLFCGAHSSRRPP